MSNLKQTIEESFTQYAGAVLQSRALVDARDCLKPSARQIFYCLYTDKFLPSKPFKKTLKAIGSVARMYIHGDSSAEGIIMRAGQPFAMRYPLVEIEGNDGNLMSSGNWAAPRYTAARLSNLSVSLFDSIDKDTIEEWRDNYDDTEQYPAVLPTRGFYNIVNGCMGIGVGAATSVPQFNIKDVNNALCTLLDNPDCDFNDIYCAPDFATGAILLNESEVKESLKNGTGFACKLRSVIDYDTKEKCLVVTEIPYSVYTNTICKELEQLLESEDNPGIERFNDLTGATPLIKIYLSKKANVDKVIKYLYKNTSLQSFYSINITMLDQGRYPRVFTWKEALQAHIDHEKIVYRRGYEFDLKKIKHRLHILDGLLICLASIDEVVATIKNSKSAAEASTNLQTKFLLDEEQAKAVLDIKLARLAHLEVEKLKKEKDELIKEAEKINEILNDEQKFNAQLKLGWTSVAAKYGDARRTKILNIEKEEDAPTEVKVFQLTLTNKNNLFLTESSTLYTQKRGGVGAKLKMDAGEYAFDTLQVESNEELLLFTQNGNFHHCAVSELQQDIKTPVESITKIDKEKICALTSLNPKTSKPYIIFVTKNGIVKKSSISEYNIKRKGSLKAITLDTNDEIISVLFTNEERIGLLTENGYFLVIETKDINAIGRVTRGIKGIKLSEGDHVVSAKTIPSTTKTIISVSTDGMIKQSTISEFPTQGKNTKGGKVQKLNDGAHMADFQPAADDAEVLVASTISCIKIKTIEIPTLLKNTIGNKAIKLSEKNQVIAIS